MHIFKQKKLSRLFLALMIASTIPSVSMAQKDTITGVKINLACGTGSSSFRDLGLVPVTLDGAEIIPNLSVQVDRPLWRYAANVNCAVGDYHFLTKGDEVASTIMKSYTPTVALSAQRKIYLCDKWRVLVGAEVEELFDARIYSELSNSSLCMSNFINLNMMCQAEFMLKRWTFSGMLYLTPFSVVRRPGYAFMDNFQQDLSSSMANQNDQSLFYGAGFTSVGTHLGATFHLKNGNSVGLNYQWRYLTSRTHEGEATAPYRLDYASHAVMLVLGFKL